MKLPTNQLLSALKRIRLLVIIFFSATILLTGASIYFAYQEDKNSKELESNAPPKENYFGANAKVVLVDTALNTMTVVSTHPSGWKKTWNLFISEDTVLATFKSWSKPSKDSKVPLSRQALPENLE